MTRKMNRKHSLAGSGLHRSGDAGAGALAERWDGSGASDAGNVDTGACASS